jgi:hypothetical protein
MFVAQDKAGSARFGPLEYTLLLLQPFRLCPSHLLERFAPLRKALRHSSQFRGYVNYKSFANCYND